MRRHHPHRFADIPVSLDVTHQLYMASLRTNSEKEDWEIVAEAVDEWTRRHNPDALAMPVTNGYQWKSLFLPDGTVLRTVLGGKNYHCVVKADQILYNEQAVSPSGCVNAVGGVRRNAWRCTWILFPNSKVWKMADTLRSQSRPRRKTKATPAIAPPPATQHAADTSPDRMGTVAPAPLPAASPSTADDVAADRAVQDATHDHALSNFSGAERGIEGEGRRRALLPQGLHRLLGRLPGFGDGRKASADRRPPHGHETR